MTSFPPVFWLSLALLFPGASSQAHASCGLLHSGSVVTTTTAPCLVGHEYPEIPDSLLFDESKEVETQDDEDLPTVLTRFESQTWIETILHARRSSYLGHALVVPMSTIRQDDRLRC